MQPLVKTAFWGFLISFLGQLPLGTLNLYTTYIAANSISNAFYFVLGCITVELIFVRIAVMFMTLISKNKKYFRILEYVSIIVIALIAFLSFRAAIYNLSFAPTITKNIEYPYFSGMLMSTIDPMKIPFWFLWTTYLLSNKILVPTHKHYNVYILGIGFGSILGFMVFIFGGNYVFDKIKDNQNILNWIVAIVLTLTVSLQVYRTFFKKEK